MDKSKTSHDLRNGMDPMQPILRRVALVLSFMFLLNSAAGAEQIVFSSYRSGNWEIWTSDENGNRPKRLTRTREEERSPAWSPDKTQIAYATGQGRLFVMDLRDGTVRELDRMPGKCDQPAWHPKGKRLAFVSYVYTGKGGEDSDIWQVEVSPSSKAIAQKLIARDEMEAFPAWSPKGDHLIYSVFRRGTRGDVIEDLWMRDMAVNTDLPFVRNESQNFQSDWSPDGRAIVFTSNMTGDYEIWLLQLTPVRLVRLTHYPGYDGDPCWSPDGGRIAFVSTRSGRKQIYVMSNDGTEPRQITRGPAENLDPDW